MEYKKLFREENESVQERLELACERIHAFTIESRIRQPFLDYFQKMAAFVELLSGWKYQMESGELWQQDMDTIQAYNHRLYADILPDSYETSYANPAYAVTQLGEDYGALLSFVYTELRGSIIYVVEHRLFDLTIQLELLVEILCLFEEGVPDAKDIRNIIYYFVSD